MNGFAEWLIDLTLYGNRRKSSRRPDQQPEIRLRCAARAREANLVFRDCEQELCLCEPG